MTSLTKKQINWLDKCTTINGIKGSWTLNSKTGLVDVEGSFDCRGQRLKGFNQGVKFGVVKKHFWCDNNRLTSLVGAPQEVGFSFDCENNLLTSLVGAPLKVGESFDCDNNRLTSLEGAPQSVGWDFYCSNNRLTSLVGAPLKVGESFYCRNNHLTSLVGAPLKVGESFDCRNNHLTSLVGAPQEVGESFDCDNNPVSWATLYAIFSKMKEGRSFVIAAASLRNEMSRKDWKLIAKHIPEAIRPGVNMLARFGVFK